MLIAGLSQMLFTIMQMCASVYGARRARIHTSRAVCWNYLTVLSIIIYSIIVFSIKTAILGKMLAFVSFIRLKIEK